MTAPFTLNTSVARPHRLVDQMRETLRARHYSLRAEQAYIHWTKRFIYFCGE
ncbi:MAG: phage integrase N-terminal SAM-like domain-containing protein [Xanthomonadales bacterium]|nr:phage integrase N-terminal SAM-like domain-containing protein [Xanthomonadales bacterium]